MKRAIKYLAVQIKRVLRFCPAVFLVTLILVSAIALIAKGLISDKLSEDTRQKVNVGICGDLGDSYLGIGVLALQNIDSSRFAVNFLMMEEDEARQALKKGELATYLVVPEDFVESVVSGENFSITMYTSNSQMGIGTMLMSELANIISDLITKSQSAIYGMQDLCIEYGYNEIYWQATDDLNIKYIDVILSRQDIFDVEVLGVSNKLSLQGYYICGFAVLFFLIFGMNGCAAFIRRDMSLGRMMAANGVGSGAQICIEFIAYLFLVVLNMLAMFCLLGGVCEMMDLSVPEWGTVEFATVFGFGCSMLPAIVMLSAMSFLGYELSGNVVSGILIQFLLSLGLGYVSGCFYPASFFPEGIQKLGNALPSGVAIQYASMCMRSESEIMIYVTMLGYTAVFLLLTGMLRKRKLEQK